MKPRIGITTWTEQRPAAPYLTVSRQYTEAIVQAGGMPWPLPPDGAQGTQEAYLDHIEGLMVTGGSDLWPGFYGQDPVPEVVSADPARDRWEIDLVRGARDRGLPVFGICRGHQLINVALGGTLWQDLATQRPGSLGHNPTGLARDILWHEVSLVPGPSRIRTVFEVDQMFVNSFHHQAVRDLAPGLVATAHSADGVVEAFEGDGPFLVGVQFHPEGLSVRYPRFASLFRAFVDACSVVTRD